MRILAPKLSEALGQQILIDNRPGGGSRIGSEIVARAAPDGYTMLFTDTALAVNPSLYSNDFTVIGGAPERYSENIRREVEKWAKVVKTAGIKAD